MLATSSTPAFSQQFSGIVRDYSTKQILPYANIGIKKKNVGGISDHTGTFQVDVSGATGGDTVVISYIGYSSELLPVSKVDFSKRHVIELKPTSHLLKELVIRSKPEIVILGNKSKSTRHTGWGDFSSSRGRAVGLLIEAPEIALKVNKVFFHLNACEFDSARVRINFFTANDNTLNPLESQTQNIFFTIHRKKGWIEVPMREDLILRKENVVVAVEWVDAWAKARSQEEGGSYLFTMSLANVQGSRYMRQTPHEPIQLTNSEFTPSIYLECVPIPE